MIARLAFFPHPWTPAMPPSRKPAVHQVPLPETGTGGYACLRELGEQDLRELVAQVNGRRSEGKEDLSLLLSWLLCDDAGSPLFDGPDDFDAHFRLSVTALLLLWDEAIRVIGLSVDRIGTAPAWADSMAYLFRKR
jgi:hypothetical protein